MNRNSICFECNDNADHNHHIVPKSLGGTKTIPLCHKCHSKIHNKKMVHSSTLIKKQLDIRKRSGKKFCRSIFGLKVVDGMWYEDDDQIKIIERIKLLHDEGYSLYYIANKLNDDDIKTSLGSVWYSQTVKNVLNTNINDYIQYINKEG
jgi:hypothetical protein